MRTPPWTVALLTMLVAAASPHLSASEEPPRLLTLADYFALASVGDPQLSPDGEWIAYTITTADLEDDKSRTRIWMVPTAGGEAVAVTSEDESSSRPRWSPDGRYLAFLSSRDEGKSQVWTLFRRGGEAMQLTDTAQDVTAFEWSPDSTRMVLVLKDPKPEELEAKEKRDREEEYKEKTPPPWVINRQQFKQDYVGYLDNRRDHLYVFDLNSKETTQITSGDYDDSEPEWSPDGTRIAFVSNRTEDPDTNYNTDIWVVAADNGDQNKRLYQVTTNPGPDAAPTWSPDGERIAHTSVTDVDAMLYATSHLAVSSAKGGDLRVLTRELDRVIFSPRFSLDGGSIYFLLKDSGEQNLAQITLSGGEPDRLIYGSAVVTAFDIGPNREIVALVEKPQLPAEVFLYANGALNQRTFTNQELLDQLRLAETVKVGFTSPDGTPIEGFVIKPPDFREGERYPTILDLHGGPQLQHDWRFSFKAQMYAANGYLVVRPNPRGSTGYGQEFCRGIWKAWGEPDLADVLAAVDDAIERGWADPDKLGVTGWSYGGMLTNHAITKTDRFKAAATGASATLYVANYGHDQYQRWWDQELGVPWKPENRELWEKLSPFNRVENVTTPTLILCGEEDWNVPVINSEQLYIALKKLGVETELVVYPGEYHGGFVPTHIQDRNERYLAWFGKYLKGETLPPSDGEAAQ